MHVQFRCFASTMKSPVFEQLRYMHARTNDDVLYNLEYCKDTHKFTAYMDSTFDQNGVAGKLNCRLNQSPSIFADLF